MFKHYYATRSVKEKRILFFLGGAMVLLLAYTFLWLPIQSKKDALKDEIASQQKLITWMQQKAPILKTQRRDPHQGPQEDLFAATEQHFRDTPFFDKLYIARLSDARVSVNFKDITFNDLLTQLTGLKKEHNADVYEMQVNRMINQDKIEGRVILTY